MNIFSINTIISVIITLLILIAVPVILYFAIRSLIRYNAQLKNGKSQQQKELDRMNIDDLQ